MSQDSGGLGELVQRWFEIDVRSLAALRIGLGLLLLWDLGNRLFEVGPFLTDEGIVPRWVAEVHYGNPGMWSVHALSGEAPLQYALLAVGLLAAVQLLVGWHTRAATFVSWFLLTSLHYRNYAQLNTGDDLLRILLVFAFFLPLGAVWSVDARSRDEAAPRAVLHPAGGTLLLLVCSVYWWVVVRRIGQDAWFAKGSAVWVALSLDAYATQFGIWVRDNLTFLLKPATWGTMILEAFGPFLAFSPWKTDALRVVTVALFVAMHLAFGSMMEIGMFFAVSCTSWLVFLPSSFWDRVVPASTALLNPQRDTDPPLLGSSVIVLLFALNQLTNVAHVVDEDWASTVLPPRLDNLAVIAGVSKEWKVYAPPPRGDGWLVVDATLADGRHVDLRDGTSPPDFTRPDDIGDSFGGQRWRRVLFVMQGPHGAATVRPYCQWLAREWERAHPGDEVASVELFFIAVRTTASGEAPEKRRSLGVIPIRDHAG